jgi:hypothetical protein
VGSTQRRGTAGRATATTVRRLVRSADQLDVVVELVDAVIDGDTVQPSGPEPLLRLTFGP